MKNKIIILGGDHHNGLNLARVFGIHGYEVYSYVVSKMKRSIISSSKYVKKCLVFESEGLALDAIEREYSEETLKPFLIPYSDGAAYAVDARLNELRKLFYVPGFKEEGKATLLMNKSEQYKWAISHGVKMARSETLNLENIDFIEWNEFPCIMKPIVSALGHNQAVPTTFTQSIPNACLRPVSTQIPPNSRRMSPR